MAVTVVPVGNGWSRRKIALVQLAKPKEGSKGYEYVATRVYDPNTGIVSDEALKSKGQLKDMSNGEFNWAAWAELPTLDIETKQLVGKNKDKYCTLIAVRVYKLAAGVETREDAVLGRFALTPMHTRKERRQPAYVLGYTFMDINGDKRYMTVSQLRKEDIFQFAHSVSSFSDSVVRMRKVMLGPRATRFYMPLVEIDDVDTSLEDEEVAQTKLFKTLVGGWYTIKTDGTIQTDRDVIETQQQLEELEIPDGVLHIPSAGFKQLTTVRRIKLPESVCTFGQCAFTYLQNLEEINIPSQVKELTGMFRYCNKLKRLDFSNVERFSAIEHLTVANLVLPDVAQKNEKPGYITIGTLEFRPTTATQRRVLRAVTGRRQENYYAYWEAKRIETNGPVVLGDYRVDVNCVDVSALEPNIIGIAPNSSFYKVDAQGHCQPWLLGPATEFVYSAVCGGYEFTDEAYAANKLRAATVDDSLDIVLPKSVSILQGALSDTMFEAEYPNVVYASHGLCRKVSVRADIEPKMPLVRWILPRGEGVCTETQIKRLEKKCAAKMPSLCERVQSLYEIDLTAAQSLAWLKRKLLFSEFIDYRAEELFKEYGMIYVGDYNEVLRGK